MTDHETDRFAQDNVPAGDDQGVSRRTFLISTGAAAVAGAAVPLTLYAQDGTPVASPVASPAAGEAQPEPSGPAIMFFNPVESAVVEGLTARILPGTPEDPGAREAGVVFYIDRTLSGVNQGESVMTYDRGPWAEVTEHETAVEATSRPDIYRAVSIEAELETRYGYQSALTPQEVYRRGIKGVLDLTEETFGKPFTELTNGEVDQLLGIMVNDESDAFDSPSGSSFFSRLRNDTIEGMFSDPMYGGNRDMVGWKLLGYPGPIGGFSPQMMHDPNYHSEPKSLDQLRNSGHSH